MLRVVALTAGLLGGIAWVANLWVEQDAVSWAGLALLAVAVAAVGAELVRQPWLQLISAVGSVALVVSVVEVLRAEVDDRPLEGVVGAAATLAVALAVWGGPGRNSSGNHRH